VGTEKVKSIIEDFGLFVFTENGKHFYSESLSRRMSVRDDAKLEHRINGIKGNLIRYGHLTKEDLSKMSNDEILDFNEKISPISGGDSHATAKRSQLKESKGKERKEKKNKEKEKSDF